MYHLFDEVQLGKLRLKNRLVMCPMGFQSTQADHSVSQRQEDYYVARARGGFGLIYPGCFVVSDKYESIGGLNVLMTQHQAVHLSTMIDKIHQYGAKVCIQLSLGMGRVMASDPYTPPASSSAIPALRFPDLMCRPLEIEEIQDLVRACGYSARLAKQAGADAVELHAYGGYLIDQFLCPLWNKRTDAYGGSMENRMRILFELRDAIWQNCGPDFPIFVKFTPDHCYPGGRTFENEGLQMLQKLDGAGFAVIHLDYGSHDNREYKTPCVYSEPGLQLEVARKAKAAGIRTPLMIQGKLDDPQVAQEAAGSGAAELFGLGHGAIADPDWPRKLRAGHPEEIIPCLGCNECLNSIGRSRRCAANPRSGFEADYPLTPAPAGKKVIVVGGGPAGCMAAITAADRGFQVELWEQSGCLGGTLRAAAAPEFKRSMRRYIDYLKCQVEKRPISVFLGRTATAPGILAAQPFGVILAAGAQPVIPPIPGSSGANVHEACQVLKNGTLEGGTIAVIGGGLVGCETALMLDGQGKNVIVVEMMDRLLAASNHPAANNETLQHMLERSSIRAFTSARVTKICADGLCIEQDHQSQKIPCDAVILAVGYRPDPTLANQLRGKVEQLHLVGDHYASRKILDATHEAFHTARLLEDL